MDQIIPITRPSAGAPVPQRTESKFPTEVINLPSKGWFYTFDNPLSSGTIELKMVTAKEEDILTSPNLLKKGIVLDKLLESVIIDKNIRLDDMFSCDQTAILYAVRRLAYGDQYAATVSCGRCNKENSVVIDLGKMDNRPFDFEQYPKGENNFTFTLPHSKNVITYKLLTKKDETAIENELIGLSKANKEVSSEVTTRLSHIITSVNGDSERSVIRRFVNQELLSRDSLVFKVHYRQNLPAIDTTFDFVCSSCGAERKEETPIGVSFFWPNR